MVNFFFWGANSSLIVLNPVDNESRNVFFYAVAFLASVSIPLKFIMLIYFVLVYVCSDWCKTWIYRSTRKMRLMEWPFWLIVGFLHIYMIVCYTAKIDNFWCQVGVVKSYLRSYLAPVKKVDRFVVWLDYIIKLCEFWRYSLQNIFIYFIYPFSLHLYKTLLNNRYTQTIHYLNFVHWIWLISSNIESSMKELGKNNRFQTQKTEIPSIFLQLANSAKMNANSKCQTMQTSMISLV